MTIIYTFISIMLAVVDCIIAAMAFAKKNPLGNYLGIACIFAAIVDCTYLVTVSTESYLINSVFSSLYFAGISCLLNVLIIFIFLFTNSPRKKLAKGLIIASLVYLGFEIIIFAINPFREIAISYGCRYGIISRFYYIMKPLYWMHLCYSYLLLAAVLFMLIYAAVRVAREYKGQYVFCVVVLLLIIAINAVFLYIPDVNIISRLDVSVFLYSLAAMFFYWACFVYPKRWMEILLKNSIIDNLDLGIILFGYDDRMLFCNEKIREYISFVNFEDGLDFDAFISRCNIELNEDLSADKYSFQWYRIDNQGNHHPYFCDYKRLKNDKGRNVGRVFIFEDAILESDPMTGFHNLEPFQAYTSHSYFEYPVVVCCCDINSLSVINQSYGRTEGDQLIMELADRLKNEFPAGTYFIRGRDANLITISNNSIESEVNKVMDKIRQTFSGTFQYSIIAVTEDDPDIVKAISKAENNVATWKLMDKESIRSDTLNSLIRALKECDDDTEAHVRRTQNMGIQLARRMNLSDSDEVNLALLCVLHDIGKIGIPLEILNKPSKLTEEEWELMKSHAEKGYKIAMSSTDFASIADPIKHHHERWDGKGYPDGLSKETIPLLSRIISVIDSYDAMINNRPYKEAMTKEEALVELMNNAGTQFDPTIVNEFVQMITTDDVNLSNDIFNTAISNDKITNRPNSASIRDEGYITADEVHLIPYARYTLDKDFAIIKYDSEFQNLTGYTDKDFEKGPINQADLIPERNRTLYFAMVAEQIANNQIAYFEHTLLRKDGSEVLVMCLGRTYFDSAVRQERSEILVFDISKTYAAARLYHAEKEKAENRLEVWEETFRKDSLTGLYNHSAFVSEVELRLISKKYKTVFLMIDIDNFKDYNDTYGHRNGDEQLILLANAIQAVLRDSDLSGRLGGDEFAIAIFFPKDISDEVIQNRIRQTFESVNAKLSAGKNRITFSMGASVSGIDNNTFKSLYDAADKAMYQSKNQGKNRLSLYEKGKD